MIQLQRGRGSSTFSSCESFLLFDILFFNIEIEKVLNNLTIQYMYAMLTGDVNK